MATIYKNTQVGKWTLILFVCFFYYSWQWKVSQVHGHRSGIGYETNNQALVLNKNDWLNQNTNEKTTVDMDIVFSVFILVISAVQQMLALGINFPSVWFVCFYIECYEIRKQWTKIIFHFIISINVKLFCLKWYYAQISKHYVGA